MPTIPKDRLEMLTWAEAHAPVFVAERTQIGLTQAQASGFAARAAAMRAAVTAQAEAKAALLAATATVVEQERQLREAGSEVVATVRAFADSQPDGAQGQVLQRAQVPAIAPQRPIAPPAVPTNIASTLESQGAITLAWKATHPRGSQNVVYFVKRRLAGESAYTLLGATGSKRFTDETIPAGTTGATYIITAQRGSVRGQDSAAVTVALGVVGVGVGVAVGVGGGSVATGSGPVKIAA